MKKITSLLLVLVMIFSLSSASFAVGNSFNYEVSQLKTGPAMEFNNKLTVGDYLTREDKDFLMKLSEMLNEFGLDNEGNLVLNRSIEEIKSEHSLTSEEVKTVLEMLSFNTLKNSNTQNKKSYLQNNMVVPNVEVRGTVIYFTNNEVSILLLAAAKQGPVAITAALTAIGLKLGPKGAFLGAALGIASGAEIARTIIRAAVTGQGFFIGFTWRDCFTMRTW